MHQKSAAVDALDVRFLMRQGYNHHSPSIEGVEKEWDITLSFVLLYLFVS